MSALKAILAKKTDLQLKYYIENVDKHTEEAVHLALEELQRRNALPADYLIKKPETVLIAVKSQTAIKKTLQWDVNVVTDDTAPQFYSQKAIYMFTVSCTPLFGSFMLASNFKSAGKPQWPVLLFGVVYLLLSALVLNYIGIHAIYPLVINHAGAMVMYEYFWKRNIKPEIKYRTKPIWIPLLIGIVMFCFTFTVLRMTIIH